MEEEVETLYMEGFQEVEEVEEAVEEVICMETVK